MNKNKKLTVTILIGLTTLSMVGCGSKANNTEFNDVEAFNEDFELNGSTKTADEIKIEDNVIIDSEDKVSVTEGEYSEEQIKSEFKILADLTSEVRAASISDAFFAVWAYDGININGINYYMEKEILKGERNAESIKIPQIKNIADVYIKQFKKENNLIKRMANGEIDPENFEEELNSINKDFTNEVMSDLTSPAELTVLIEKHGLSISDLFNPETINNNASSIFKDKYEQNIQDYLKKIIKDLIG